MGLFEDRKKTFTISFRDDKEIQLQKSTNKLKNNTKKSMKNHLPKAT